MSLSVSKGKVKGPPLKSAYRRSSPHSCSIIFARADSARCTRDRLRFMVGKGCDEELIAYAS